MDNEQKIRMQLFGDFSLQRGNVTLDRTELHSNKVMKLLAYLILYRNRKLTRQELMDIFWEDESKNPAGALKNLMYRLRVALKVLGEEEFISTYSGGYQWNPEIACFVDAEEFERLCLAADSPELPKEERLLLYNRALNMYMGDLVLGKANLSWAIPLISRYHNRYITAVKNMQICWPSVKITMKWKRFV